MATIQTTYGEMDESELRKVERVENGVVNVKYFKGDELVHESATVPLTGIEASVQQAQIG